LQRGSSKRAIQLVGDVDFFVGHIACLSSKNFELVIPCFNKIDHFCGVLDTDSGQPHFFTWQGFDQSNQMLQQLFQNVPS
jgi:putative methionine-R-sulfoxide reductase with GAF domain